MEARFSTLTVKYIYTVETNVIIQYVWLASPRIYNKLKI